MAEQIPIPFRLKKFPLYKGMLVHFTVYVGEDGIPDFKVVHENNRRICMRDNLCALCGQGLLTPMVFIGGTKSVENRLFVDGPMHQECAEYATKVCPFLKIETWTHTDRKPRHEGKDSGVFSTFNELAPGRPRMAMYYTNGYRLVRVNDSNNIYYQALAPLKVDWDAMPQPKEEPDGKDKTS